MIHIKKNFKRLFSTNNIKEINPVLSYDNADLDKYKIYRDNKNKSGIYLWINKLNKNCYVGGSKNIGKRMSKYFSFPSLNKSTRLIEKALVKYGYSNFKLVILEYCNKEDILNKEQYYIDHIGPKYNIVLTAGSTLGYKFSNESLKKRSEITLSDKARKIKAYNLNKFAVEAKRIKVTIFNVKTFEKKHYNSIREAASDMGVPNQSLSYCLRKNTLYKKTYKISITK